jgi:sugar lactone lactonase YvrE
MVMKRLPKLMVLGISFGVSLLAAGAVRAQTSTIDLGAGSRPESVTKAWGGKLYVSCQNAGTLGLNDGEIKTFDLNGNVSVFATGLDNPRGMAFTGKYLVVTDTSRIWKIDQAGNKTVLADPPAFPNPVAFFNDAATEEGGRAVFVSEMGGRTLIRDAAGFLVPTDSAQAWSVPATSRIYRITLDGRVSEVVSPSRKVLIINGVTTANRDNKLLIAEFFYGNIVLAGRHRDTWKILATGFRGADGIEQAKDGTIYVSSFENGAVWKMDEDGENITPLIENVGRQSTADFYLDEPGHRLLVPDTLHGVVIVLPS